MNEVGLNQGTSGNISVRHEGSMLITPTSVPYDELSPAMIVKMPIDGQDPSVSDLRHADTPMVCRKLGFYTQSRGPLTHCAVILNYYSEY